MSQPARSTRQQPLSEYGSRTASRLALTGIWLVALVPDNGAAPSWLLTGLSSAYFCVVLLFALVARARFALPKAVLLLTGFFVLILCATLASGDPVPIPGLLRTAALALTVAMLVVTAGPDRRPFLYRGILALTVLLALIALSQSLFGFPVTWGWLGDTSAATAGTNPLSPIFAGRSPATMGHAIPLALVLGIGILIALGIRPLHPVLRVAVLAVLSVALIATGTRSAVLVLSVVLLFLAYFTLHGRIGLLIKAGATVLAILIATQIDFLDLPPLASLNGSFSLENRVNAWDVLTAFLQKNPLSSLWGIGWGGVSDLSRQGLLYSASFSAIDNNFVTSVVVGGFVGMLLLVGLMVRAFVGGDQITRAVLALFFGMFLSFDVLLWQSSLVLLVTFVVIGWHDGGRDSRGGDTARHPVAAVGRVQDALVN